MKNLALVCGLLLSCSVLVLASTSTSDAVVRELARNKDDGEVHYTAAIPTLTMDEFRAQHPELKDEPRFVEYGQICKYDHICPIKGGTCCDYNGTVCCPPEQSCKVNEEGVPVCSFSNVQKKTMLVTARNHEDWQKLNVDKQHSHFVEEQGTKAQLENAHKLKLAHASQLNEMQVKTRHGMTKQQMAERESDFEDNMKTHKSDREDELDGVKRREANFKRTSESRLKAIKRVAEAHDKMIARVRSANEKKAKAAAEAQAKERKKVENAKKELAQKRKAREQSGKSEQKVKRNSPVRYIRLGRSIYNRNGISLCMTNYGGRIRNGNRVVVWQCSNHVSQRWKLYADGTIRPEANQGMCLDLHAGRVRNGNHLQIWKCHKGANQRWRFLNDKSIRTMVNQRFTIDVHAGWFHNGNKIQIWAKYPNNPNQMFAVTKTNWKPAQNLYCYKKKRSPSRLAGKFSWPIFRYPHGWNFRGGWWFNSFAALVGDFNGDGRDDYARLGGTYIHFFISKGNGQYFYPIYPFPRGWNFGHNEGIWTSLRAMDVNGDKRADIIRTYYTYNHGFISRGSDAACWRKNGWISRGCMRVTTNRYPRGWSFRGGWRWTDMWQVMQGDFNNDKRADYARLGPTYIHFFISKGNGQFWWPIYRFPRGWNFGWSSRGWVPKALDFNGDCRTDIIRTHGRYHHSFSPVPGSERACWTRNGWIHGSCLKIGTYRYPHGWNFRGGWTWYSRAFVTGDFNGDGMHDFARLGGRYIHFFISRGDGWFFFPIYPFPRGWNFGHNEYHWTTIQGDFDGDGRQDIIRTTGHYNHGFYSRGSDAACWRKNGWIPRGCMKVTYFRYPHRWNFRNGYWRWDSLATLVGDFQGKGRDSYINARHGRYTHQFFSR